MSIQEFQIPVPKLSRKVPEHDAVIILLKHLLPELLLWHIHINLIRNNIFILTCRELRHNIIHRSVAVNEQQPPRREEYMVQIIAEYRPYSGEYYLNHRHHYNRACLEQTKLHKRYLRVAYDINNNQRKHIRQEDIHRLQISDPQPSEHTREEEQQRAIDHN